MGTSSNHYYMKKKQKVININGYLSPFSSVSHLLPKNVNNIKLWTYQLFFLCEHETLSPTQREE
jgi:hypothetical protein